MPLTDPLERLKSAGRNDDCPCGSGKKYKKCHLRQDEESASKALAEANAERAKTAEAEGHVHGPDCEHDDAPARPKATPQPLQSPGGPKTPLSHKPMNTPRKAV